MNDDAERIAALTKENDFLRTRLAESDFDCVYCQLPKSDLPKCASGFPGCARADDLFQCDELTRRDERKHQEGGLYFARCFLRHLEQEDPPLDPAILATMKRLTAEFELNHL